MASQYAAAYAIWEQIRAKLQHMRPGRYAKFTIEYDYNHLPMINANDTVCICLSGYVLSQSCHVIYMDVVVLRQILHMIE